MANKFDSPLKQVDELEVASLECGQMLGAHVSVEISRLDSGELGQVVYNLQCTISEILVAMVT